MAKNGDSLQNKVATIATASINAMFSWYRAEGLELVTTMVALLEAPPGMRVIGRTITSTIDTTARAATNPTTLSKSSQCCLAH